jgi:hypothetical protein
VRLQAQRLLLDSGVRVIIKFANSESFRLYLVSVSAIDKSITIRT